MNKTALTRDPSTGFLRVLRELVQGPRYAEQLSKQIGMERARAFQILQRLEVQGVLTSKVDEPPLHRRRWYELTAEGRAKAVEVLTEAGTSAATTALVGLQQR